MWLMENFSFSRPSFYRSTFVSSLNKTLFIFCGRCSCIPFTAITRSSRVKTWAWHPFGEWVEHRHLFFFDFEGSSEYVKPFTWIIRLPLWESTYRTENEVTKSQERLLGDSEKILSIYFFHKTLPFFPSVHRTRTFSEYNVVAASFSVPIGTSGDWLQQTKNITSLRFYSSISHHHPQVGFTLCNISTFFFIYNLMLFNLLRAVIRYIFNNYFNEI